MGEFSDPEKTPKVDRKIQELWMACYTQEEIAEAVGCTRDEVRGVSEGFGETVLENQIPKTQAFHLIDFEPPLYNVWKQQEKD